MEPAAPSASTSCWPLRDADALLDAFEAGRLDDDLSAVIDVINRRTSTIARNRTQAALARLNLNDRVRIGDNAKPQYIRGETGTVHELNDDYVVVLLDRVVGKFKSRHLRCAPEMVELAQDS
ncbi:MAG TPA: hypothetical protein VFC03_04060 [Acidimicrobiales bacterium]|jgi:hypothetical protein|nr:hypothetical protein [Acidimicrobiales bacterium]